MAEKWFAPKTAITNKLISYMIGSVIRVDYYASHLFSIWQWTYSTQLELDFSLVTVRLVDGGRGRGLIVHLKSQVGKLTSHGRFKIVLNGVMHPSCPGTTTRAA